MQETNKLQKNKGIKNQKKKLGILILAILIVLAGFGVDLFCQREVLNLPQEEQGVFSLGLEVSEQRGFERTDQGWQRSGYEGRMVIPLEGRFVGRFAVDYECENRLDLTWTVYLTGEEEPLIIEDGNSMFLNTTVERLDAQVDQIVLYWLEDTEEENDLDFCFSEFYIINQYQISWHRILFVWTVLGLVVFLVLGRKWITDHLAESYFIAAIVIGSLMILLASANKVSWDEEVHFFHAYCVSHFGTEVKTNDILEKLFVADEENWPYSIPVNQDERVQMNEALNTLVAEEEYSNNRGRALAGIYTPAYIPSAVGIRLGLLLHLPFTAVYQLGRLCNLLFCAFVMAWAIKRIPVGKAILAVIGLLPTPLFLMAMYSYDSFITSLFALGFAYFLDEYLHREKKISWFRFAVIVLSFAAGSMPKAIYVPLILVFFLLPKEKFADRKQEIWMKGIAAGLFLALMASFVLPTVLSPAESNDTRGGNTSEAGQIPYILSDIPRFINMMVYSIRTTFAGFVIGASVYGSLGHLALEMMGMIIPVFVLCIIFADEKSLPENRLTWPARSWTLLLCLGIMAMVWLAMYLAFTPVGYDHVNGVQARYYIPLLLPIYLCLCPDRVKIGIGKNVIYPVALSGAAGITLIVTARAMLVLCV